MVYLKLWIFNVGHGNCVYGETPKRNFMLDCGADETNGFSPAKLLKEKYNAKNLDYLLISHPHVDHICDIINVDNYMSPTVLSRNKIIDVAKIEEENSEVFETHKDIIEKYLDMNSRYNQPLQSLENPKTKDWSDGVRIVEYSNKDSTMNLNDLSIVAFMEFGGYTILYGGDLEEKGWNALLSKNYFVEWLRSTDVLIASHHGRESGFSSEIFKYCKPKLTIISDGRFGDTSATNRYVSVTSGMKVKNKGTVEDRKVITTRNDGHIFLQNNGTDLSVQLGWKS